MDARLTDRCRDLLLAALTAVLFVAQIASQQQIAAERPAALAAALAFSATVVWRRRLPLVPLVAGTMLIEVSNLVEPALANTGTFFVVYVLVIYSAGRHTRAGTPAAAQRSSARSRSRLRSRWRRSSRARPSASRTRLSSRWRLLGRSWAGA